MNRMDVCTRAGLGLVVVMGLTSYACSRTERNPSAPSPALSLDRQPSAAALPGSFAPMPAPRPPASIGNGAIDFPPRNEPFAFRNELEAKYRDGLKRSAVESFVDIEGDIVWTTEYLRYRLNGCAHADAVRNALVQIDGAPGPPVCGAAAAGPVAFPPRNEPFAFRNELEAKYRDGLRRPANLTFVDIEGDIVWTTEYLRYRLNNCSHIESVQKALVQIDGAPAPAVCSSGTPTPPPTPPPPPPPPPTPAAPTVASISPTQGPATGGTAVTISGTGFLAGASVQMGGVQATGVTVVNSQTVTATAPAHAAGTVSVVVTNPDGRSGTLAGAFTYMTPPVTPPSDATITITSSGVSPKMVSISVRGRVTFVNNNTRAHDMSSDPHPAHTECPEINAVGFIQPGQTKQTAPFDTAKTCGFHDHNQDSNTSLQGTIVVR